jgi:DNA-binding Lrp family transcriptional regulator
VNAFKLISAITHLEDLDLKDAELKLLSELMKNSRRSDRELAKAVGVSQPTVSRTIKKLEKEGYIKEFTIIPDFKKLGFQILTIVFAKLGKELSQDLIKEVARKGRENEKKNPSSILMVMSGMGCDADRVIILLSKDYSTYTKYINAIERYPLVEVKSFMIDLCGGSHFLPLTLSNLAGYLEKQQKKDKEA